ncbi:MAG: alpha-hydroxy-acid oxidizing protein, partial [Solirubrobacterales bacterium]
MDALERAAERAMSPQAFAYVAAGAGNESTKRANEDSFGRWRIVPRMLRDVAHRDLGMELFGRRIPAPLMLSPVGVLEMAHRDADAAAARAAGAEGVPMIFSNQASRPMEACARELGDSPRWFQLYWSTKDDLVASFVSRAEACGCEAIVLTLDTTLLGWRTRDLDIAYLPFLRGKGIAQYTSDPVFRRIIDEEPVVLGKDEQPKPTPAALRTLIQLTRAYPDRFAAALRSGHARAAVQTFVRIYSRPSLTWEDLPFLRERTKLPILLKGILHPDDATRAVDEGIDGIIVSNHGGRQVDGATSTIEALPGIARAVDRRIPIVLDSGVRSCADAFKALSLGGSGVGIVRPYAYGLAIAGVAGVREVLHIFK